MIESGETTRTRVLRSTMWTTGTKALGQAMTFITTIILANLLEKYDFGLMSMALVYMGLIDTFIDFGFMSAIIQARNLSIKQLSSCFWVLTAISSLVFVVSFAGAVHIARLFGEQGLAGIIGAIAVSLLFIPPQIIGKGILSRALRLDIIARMEFGAGILRAGVSILFAYLGAGVWSLVYGFLAEKVLLALLLLFSAKWRPRLEYDRTGITPLLSFGMNVTLGNILWYVYSRADFFIIGRLLGAEILGVYTIASQFANTFVQFISVSLHRLIYPLFARYQESPYLKEAFIKSSVYLVFVSSPVIVGLASVAPDVIDLFLGERWHDAVFPMQILSLVAAMKVVNYLFTAVLNAIGRPSTNTRMNFYSTVVFGLSFYCAAIAWGMNGILLVWAVLYPFRYMVYLLITSRLLQFSTLVYLKRHMGTAIACAAMFFTVFLVQHIGIDWNILVRMTVCITTGALVYLLLQALLSMNEMKELFGLVKEMAYLKHEATD